MARRKQYGDDDGRSFTNMNVEGMPWYVKAADQSGNASSGADPVKLTKQERRAFMRGVMAAMLVVAGIFFVVFFVLILVLYLIFLKKNGA